MTRATARRLAITEAQFQKWVTDVAELYGWRWVHIRPARVKGADGEEDEWRTPYEGHSGLPDLILARDGVVLVRELKSARGILTADQRKWLDELGPCGGVWRPGEEEKILAELRRRW